MTKIDSVVVPTLSFDQDNVRLTVDLVLKATASVLVSQQADNLVSGKCGKRLPYRTDSCRLQLGRRNLYGQLALSSSQAVLLVVVVRSVYSDNLDQTCSKVCHGCLLICIVGRDSISRLVSWSPLATSVVHWCPLVSECSDLS
jgi:hypothetical protein